MMNPIQLIGFLPQLRQNPAAFLQQMLGVQIPPNMTDPNAILDWFVETGKYSREQIDSLKYQLGISR